MPSPTGQPALPEKLLARLSAEEREYLNVLAKRWQTSVNHVIRTLISEEKQRELARQRPQTPPPPPAPAGAAPARSRPAPRKAPKAPRTGRSGQHLAGSSIGFSDVFREPRHIEGQTAITDPDQ